MLISVVAYVSRRYGRSDNDYEDDNGKHQVELKELMKSDAHLGHMEYKT